MTLTGKIRSCFPQSGVQPALCQLMTGSDSSHATQSRTLAVSVTPAIAATAFDLHQVRAGHQERRRTVDLVGADRRLLLDRLSKSFEEWPALQNS